MSLLLVPYNNAMRLGQGFNSYTQQICIDDAVVINHNRAENVLLNDGTTMRILAQSQAKPSAWTRQKEIILDDRALDIEKPAADDSPAKDHPAEDPHGGVKPLVAAQVTDTPVKDTPGDQAIYDGTSSANVAGPTYDAQKPFSETEPVDCDEGASEDTPPETSDESSQIPEAATPEDDGNEPAADVAPAKEEPTSGNGGSVVSENPESAEVPAKTVPTPKLSGGRQRSASVGGKKSNGSSPQVFTRLATKPLENHLRGPEKVIVAQSKPGQPQVHLNPKTQQQQKDEEQLELMRQAEMEKLKEAREYQRELDAEKREEDRQRRIDDRDEQRRIRQEKREFEAKRREEAYKAISDAAAAKKEPLSMEEMRKVVQQNQFAERWNGLGENTENFTFDATAPRGPSQTVTYTSRFVDRLSDITDDMCISGSLSIKAAKIGGSGRGSFIDSDKFKESDLNFYISVKVANQTINFKDALEYNPLRSVSDTAADFNKVYGDSFISGFQEGGEFNALVSMKILNKAKKTDIQAEAKVAFTTGPMSVEATANVGIAQQNIETNTETTIQVSWMGGGHIKPMEQQWDIKSLMAAAARFPDLVADCPQRTYAILTKYDNLRSFVARKPAAYTKFQYENAQLYTNVLMEAFMSYKTLYKQISDYMFQIRQNTMEIVPWERKDAADAAYAASKAATIPTDVVKESSNEQMAVTPGTHTSNKQSKEVEWKKNKESGLYPYVEDNTRYDASLGGLDQARRAIRRQMARIANEVDLIEGDPKVATDEDHQEPFQPPASLEMRIPTVEIPENLRPKENPLTGKLILAKPQTEEERKKEAEELKAIETAPKLHSNEEPLDIDEVEAFKKCVENNPSLGHHLQVTQSVGSSDKTMTSWFNNLDFLREEWHIKTIKIKVADAVVRSVSVEYENGLVVQRGETTNSSHGRIFELGHFAPGERITAGSIEEGTFVANNYADILSVHLYTNHGRVLMAECTESKPIGDGKVLKDGHQFSKIRTVHVDNPFGKGTLKGFFGRDTDEPNRGFVLRLGFIWGDIMPQPPSTLFTGSNEQQVIARRSVPSRWGQTRCDSPLSQTDLNHSAKFGVTYFRPPKVMYGLSEIRSYSINYLPASWSMEGDGKPTVNHTGFNVKTHRVPGVETSTMDFSWLTLPDNEVNFNVGYHDFKAEINGNVGDARAQYNVVFDKPYTTMPATPAVWCVSLNFAGAQVPEPRVAAEVSNLTTTGFTLTVNSWDGSKIAGNVWGWCVWDKEYDGVKVTSGMQHWDTQGKLIAGETRIWEPDFGGKQPVSIMTGIVGFNMNIVDNIGVHMFHVKSKYMGSLGNGYISYGPDSTTNCKWMGAMYVAILED